MPLNRGPKEDAIDTVHNSVWIAPMHSLARATGATVSGCVVAFTDQTVIAMSIPGTGRPENCV